MLYVNIILATPFASNACKAVVAKSPALTALIAVQAIVAVQPFTDTIDIISPTAKVLLPGTVTIALEVFIVI